MGGNFGKNVVIAVSLLAAGFLAAWFRFRPQLGTEGVFTDGARTIEIAGMDELRYAMWDEPVPMEGELNTDEDEQAPAISPDGRYLVFVVGERGLGTDLWIADLDARGIAKDPRPLPGVNSPSDDLAPSFAADGALLFASNRPGGMGGLDIWRAPYEGGVFDAAEHLEGNVNTDAEETDPASIPGTDNLVFASSREREDAGAARAPRGGGLRLRQFDLYLADPLPRGVGQDAVWAVSPLDELNTLFDERDPCFSLDGRALLFSSNREGGVGDFDLYRSSRAPRDRDRNESPGDWLPAMPLDGVNTARAERCPRPTADGFTLLFSRAEPVSTQIETAAVDLGSEPDFEPDFEPGLAAAEITEVLSWDVWRATSRELVRTPGRPVGWREILILGLLLILALLAALAKRWRGMDVIYKAFLISLLVHLAFLIWSRDVSTDSDPVNLPNGDPNRVRVRLVDDPDSVRVQRNQERGGAVEVMRTEVEASAEPAATDAPSAEAREAESAPMAAASLQRSTPEPASAPERAPSDAPDRTAEAKPVSTELKAQEQAFEKLAGAAPSLQVNAQKTEAQRAEAAQKAVERAASDSSASAVLPEVASAAASPLARSDRARPAAERAPSARDVRVDRSDEAASAKDAERSLEVGRPSESFEKFQADARASNRPMDVAASDGASAGQRKVASSDAAVVLPSASDASGEREVALAPEAASGLARSERSAPTAPGPGKIQVEVARGSTGQDVPSVDVVDAPSDPFGTGPRMTADAPSFDALSGSGSDASDLARERSGAADPSAAMTAAPSAALSAGVADAGDAGDPTTLAPSTASDLQRSRAGTGAGPPAFAGAPAAMAAPERSVNGTSTRDIEVVAPAGLEATPKVAAAAPTGPTGQDLAPMDTGAPLRRSNGSASGSAPGLVSVSGPGERSRIVSPAPMALDIAAPTAPKPIAVTPSPGATPDQWDRTPYQSRTGTRKLAALEEFGGNEATEAAVENGLAYLAKRQRSGGRWGRKEMDDKYGQPMIGKTGLATLAFMGAGHTTASDSKYSEVVAKALEFMISEQSPTTGHIGKTTSYGHAIATYALGEAFALTEDPALRGPLEAAVQQIVNSQASSRDPLLDGGWSYYFGDGRKSDRWPRASVTAWQVMALESAKLGGIPVPSHVFTRARTFLVNTWDPKRGAFRYSHDPSRLRSDYPLLPGSTPATMFALSLLGADIADKQFAPARRFVQEKAPDGYRFTGDDDFVFKAQGNLYFWYYGTLAMFRVGGQDWRRWNSAMKDTLVPAQERDGSWRPISIYAEYAQDSDGDRTYTTAMNVLTLEVYYRYFTPLLKVE